MANKWVNTKVVIDIESGEVLHKEGYYYTGPLALLVDNVVLNNGTGGATCLTDDCTTGHAQIIKLAISADGDATLIPADAANGIDVDVTRSALPTGAATSAKQDTIIGHLDGVEGLLTTIDGDTGTLAVVGGGVEATALRVTVASDSTGVLSVDDNNSSLTVDGTVTANLAAGTNNIGDVDVLTFPPEAHSADFDTGVGTDTTLTFGIAVPAAGGAAVVPGSATAGLKVDLGADNDVTVTGTVTANLAAGTNNIGDVDVLSIAAGDNNIGNVDIVTMPNVTLAAGTNTNEVVGDAAHDAAAAGNPVLVAGVAQDMDDTAPPNRVSAESDTTRIATDRDGGVFVHPHGPQIWSYHENSSSQLTDTSVHVAPGAGLSLYITDIVCSTGAATAMNIFFEEDDGTPATCLGPYYLEAVAGRGVALHFQTPKKLVANAALTVTTSAAIAHSIDVTGFTAAG